MNGVDLSALALLAGSGLLSFLRGFVREVLSVVAWGGATVFATAAGPQIEPKLMEYIDNPAFAKPAAHGIAFVTALVTLSIIANLGGRLMRASMLSGMDRTLGVVYGVIRGAALIVFAYIIGGLLLEIDRWPAQVLQARLLPYVYDGAVLVAGWFPEKVRPRVYPPPAEPETRAADLLHASPQGRALGGP